MLRPHSVDTIRGIVSLSEPILTISEVKLCRQIVELSTPEEIVGNFAGNLIEIVQSYCNCTVRKVSYVNHV